MGWLRHIIQTRRVKKMFTVLCFKMMDWLQIKGMALNVITFFLRSIYKIISWSLMSGRWFGMKWIQHGVIFLLHNRQLCWKWHSNVIYDWWNTRMTFSEYLVFFSFLFQPNTKIVDGKNGRKLLDSFNTDSWVCMVIGYANITLWFIWHSLNTKAKLISLLKCFKINLDWEKWINNQKIKSFSYYLG